MENRTFRVSLAMVLVFMGILFFASVEDVSAMGDRSAAGSVSISANGEVSVAEGKEVKLNFGTKHPDSNNSYYFKIVPSKTGYITFSNDFNCKVFLCNSAKKVISASEPDYGDLLHYDSQYPHFRTISYGVKKGTTYYVRVKSLSMSYPGYQLPYIGSVKWTNGKVKPSKYGKSKKKAKAIKRKKTVKGIIYAGSTKGQWYKIKTKSKKTKITFTSKHNCGTLIMEVKYKSYGRWWTDRIRVYRDEDGWKNGGKFVSSVKKNTVYLRIVPDKKSSGEYTIKWQ